MSKHISSLTVSHASSIAVGDMIRIGDLPPAVVVAVDGLTLTVRSLTFWERIANKARSFVWRLIRWVHS